MLNTDIVMKHLALANKLAYMYISQRPSERHEILSAAYYGLFQVAFRDNPTTSYVSKRIAGAVKDVVRRYQTLTRRERTFLCDYLRCDGNLMERAEAMGLPADVVFHRLASMTFLVPLSQANQVAARRESDLPELLELCLSYLPAHLHWSFTAKYRDQMNSREIAAKTGMARVTVLGQLRRAIRILRLHKGELADIIF